jgi:ribosomal protein S18 acetylase RimI-like enzyme
MPTVCAGASLSRHAAARLQDDSELEQMGPRHARALYACGGRPYVRWTKMANLPGPLIPPAAMLPSLSIRPFVSPDQPALEQLWQRVFADDPPWNAPGLLIANKLHVQPELLLVALLDETLVGAVMAGYDGVRGWIYHLAVAPEWRRRGVATALVRAAEGALRKLGCPKVNLQVRAANTDVVAFYQTLGFAVEERVSMGRRLEAE